MYTEIIKLIWSSILTILNKFMTKLNNRVQKKTNTNSPTKNM